jgi:PAS domain S-box-containing protein
VLKDQFTKILSAMIPRYISRILSSQHALLLIILTLIGSFVANLYGLIIGLSIVIPHLFYIPIILAAFFYPRRGVVFAIIVSTGYFLMVVAVRPGTSPDIISAAARCVVFILIAIIVSYLSDQVSTKERALIRAKEEWENTFNGVPDLIAIMGKDRRILRVNRAMAESLRISPDQAVGLKCYDVVHASKSPPLNCPHDMLLKDGREHTAEIHEGNLGGDFLVTVSPLHDDEGNLIGSIHVARDITERKQVEIELLMHSEILQNMAEGVALIRAADEKIVFTNTRFSQLFGYPDGELIGQPVAVLNAPNGRSSSEIAREIEDELEKYGIWAGEIRSRKKDGGLFYCHAIVSTYIHPIYGKVWISVHEDITEKKRIEAALTGTEQRYRQLYEGMRDAFASIDLEGRITGFNSAFATMVGYTPEEIYALTFRDLTPEQWLISEEQILKNQVMIRGYSDIYEKEYRRKDGTVLPVELRTTLITGEDGIPQGMWAIIRDISERKKIQEALKAALTKLNMLSSITRHDILNQVTGLRTYLELSREDLRGTPFAAFIEKEDQAADAIQRQIEFTRYYQDIGVNEPIWQDPAAVIREAVTQLNLPSTEVQVTVTGVEIFADPLIVKVFFNLMENSLRHGERVTQMSFSSCDSGAGLVITYRDNGVGISTGDKKKLFQKGFGKHTGLGLFLSQEILAITSITITENGEPGKGVQFEITVPKGGYRFIA